MPYEPLSPLEPFEQLDHSEHMDWNSVMSISLGELIDTGYIDFSTPAYDFDSYSDEQRNAFWNKFEARFRYKDISMVPPERWRRRLISILNEWMPRLKPLYAALESGQNPMQTGDEYHKRREIRSEFPQTMLSGREDYASSGFDVESETVRTDDFIGTSRRLATEYRDPDSILLDACERVFSQIYSTHINAL